MRVSMVFLFVPVVCLHLQQFSLQTCVTNKNENVLLYLSKEIQDEETHFNFGSKVEFVYPTDVDDGGQTFDIITLVECFTYTRVS